MKFKAIITGAVSFALVYIVPVTSTAIQGLIRGVPAKIGAKGIGAGLLNIVVALLLWGLLYLIFRGKKKME